MSGVQATLLLLTVALAYVLFVTACVAILTLYCAWAARNDEQDEAQARAFAGRSSGLARRAVGLLLEGLLQALAFVSEALHWLRLLPAPKGPGTGPPVVLLAGYTENSGQMWFLARRLAKAGFDPVLVDFPSSFQGIEPNRVFLRDKLQEIREAWGSQPIAIVAHSMAGVVSRALIHTHPEHGVGVLVCIASPHRGTHLASALRSLGIGGAVQDLFPASPLLRQLPPSLVGEVPIHCIVGFQEDIISPAWSGVLLEGDNVVLERPVGHITPLFSDAAWLQIRHWLLQHGFGPKSGPATPSVG